MGSGVLLSTPGDGAGGADLSAFANEHFSFFYNPSFTEITTPALVVAGDADVSPHLTMQDAD